MSPAEERLALLNNPYTNVKQLSLADMALPTPPTKAETKAASVSATLETKRQQLGVNPQFQSVDMSIMGGNSGETNVLDLAEASFYRAGGNLADAGKGLANWAVGTNFDDSQETGWSNNNVADRMAGVSDEYRQQLQEDQGKVLSNVQDGNYWEAAKAAGKVGVRTAFDSAATMGELAAGAALTGGVGTAVKVGKGVKALKNIGKATEAVEKGRAVQLAQKAATEVIKNSGKASFITADIVQQQRADYIAENGEEPSTARVAGMTLLTLATTAWQPKIAEKLYLPKAMQGGKAKDIATQYAKDVKALLDRAEPSILPNLARRVASGAGKIAQAGGAEAVQEYAQTWAGILGTKMDPEEAGGLLQAAMEEFSNQENIDETITAAFLGGAAGGAARGMQAAPGVGLGTALDTAIGGQKALNRKIAEAAEKQKNAYLNENERAARIADARERVKQFDASEASIKEQIKVLGSIKDASQLESLGTDNEVFQRVASVTKPDEDLTDPEQFEAVVKRTVKAYADDTAKIKSARALEMPKLAVKEAAKSTKKATVDAGKKAIESLNITEEQIDDAIEAMSTLGRTIKNEAISVVKDYRSSKVNGFVQLTAEAIDTGSKASLAKAKEVANEMDPEVVVRMAEVADKAGSTRVASTLRNIATRREAAQKAAGVKTDKTYTEDTIDNKIKATLKKSGALTETETSVLATKVSEVAKGKIHDEATAKLMMQAVDKIKASEHKTSYSDSQLDSFKSKFELAAKENKTNTQKVKEAGAKATAKVKETLEDRIPESVTELVKDQLTKVRDRISKIGIAADTQLANLISPKGETVVDLEGVVKTASVTQQIFNSAKEKALKSGKDEKTATEEANQKRNKMTLSNLDKIKGYLKAENPEDLKTAVIALNPEFADGDNLQALHKKAYDLFDMEAPSAIYVNKSRKDIDDKTAEEMTFQDEEGTSKLRLATKNISLEEAKDIFNICR